MLDLLEAAEARIDLHFFHGSCKARICAQIVLGTDIYQVFEQRVSNDCDILSGSSLADALGDPEVALNYGKLHLVIQRGSSLYLSLADANVSPLVQ